MYKRNKAEPLHDKTNKMICAHSQSDQSSLSARNLGSLATHWAHSEDWSHWADAQAGLSLCWVHSWFCWFLHSPAQLTVVYIEKLNIIDLACFLN